MRKGAARHPQHLEQNQAFVGNDREGLTGP
jgi:hypothetical protein